jgi:hypothetical protein
MKIFFYEEEETHILFLVQADDPAGAHAELWKLRHGGVFHYKGESSQFDENDGKGPIGIVTDGFRVRLPQNDLRLEKMHVTWPDSPRRM